MESLVSDMVQDDPAKRPTIDEVISKFEKAKASLGSWKLRSRMIDRNEWTVIRMFKFLPHVVQTISQVVTRKPAVPFA